MTSQDWVNSNCKFAALSPTDQARSEVVGTAYAVISQYKNYKANPTNEDLQTLFMALDTLARSVEKAKNATQPEQQNATPMAQG